MLLHPKEKIVISAGRPVPWKGFDLLREVVEELQAEGEKVRLVIATDLPKEQLWQQFQAADIFALNTGYEGLSHQILEAMSFGLPVVTTNVGGNPEVIKDGENGFLVSYNDKTAFKEKIKLLLNDENLAHRLGQNGKNSLDKFTLERMLSEIKDIF